MPDSDQNITPFSLFSRERQAYLEKLTHLLEGDKDTISAYTHGSFVQDLPFRDLDIAIYLDPSNISLDRDPEARVACMEYIISRYLDMEPILRHHIREVVESRHES